MGTNVRIAAYMILSKESKYIYALTSEKNTWILIREEVRRVLCQDADINTQLCHLFIHTYAPEA
jgi:hypothetical protein